MYPQQVHRQYKTGTLLSTAFQKDFNRKKKRAEKNLMKFRKEKCEVLHLGMRDPRLQYRLGAEQLENSSAEKGL